MALESQEGKSYTRLARDGTSSLWFNKFMQGCKNRMGQDVRSNLGMSTELMLALLDRCSTYARNSKTNQLRFDWLITGAYFCFCYVTSLRGTEGRMLDLQALIEYNKPSEKRVIVGLRGKIKGEHRSRTHLFPCCNVTASGINVRHWMRLLIGIHKFEGRINGPAVCDQFGVCLTSATLDARLHLALNQIRKSNNELFPKTIRLEANIKDKYHVFRTLRKTSVGRAKLRAINQVYVDIVNCWSQVNRAGVKQANLPMHLHYAQLEELAEAFEAYTSQM